ncbi:MAG: DinB family protein [Acidobacteriota bacterium]
MAGIKMIDSLIMEFKHEAEKTRKHLERLPNSKLDWRPHEKSFTAGALASHIVECIHWADSIFNLDELDIDPTTYKPYQATSLADLLKAFDDNVANCNQVLAGIGEEAVMQPWRLKIMGKLRFEMPKAAVFRDFTLSHLIHHRGQFSVYLRLLNVAVPGSYGPTADEQA